MIKLFRQIIKFGLVGAVATLIDMGLLFVLTSGFEIDYMVSSTISFSVSVIFNYIASMRFVFAGKTGMSKGKEFWIFIILSILGLLLNQMIMWFGVEVWHIYYMLTKVVATIFVMTFNFVTRKIFLED